jgi:hypothetical protein
MKLLASAIKWLKNKKNRNYLYGIIFLIVVVYLMVGVKKSDRVKAKNIKTHSCEKASTKATAEKGKQLEVKVIGKGIKFTKQPCDCGGGLSHEDVEQLTQGGAFGNVEVAEGEIVFRRESSEGYSWEDLRQLCQGLEADKLKAPDTVLPTKKPDCPKVKTVGGEHPLSILIPVTPALEWGIGASWKLVPRVTLPLLPDPFIDVGAGVIFQEKPLGFGLIRLGANRD